MTFFTRTCYRICLTILALFVLTRCATLPPTPLSAPPLSAAARTRALTQLDHWHLRGALALRTPQGSETAHWQWQRSGALFSLHLAGPLNIGAINIDGAPHQVILTTASGKRYVARTPDQLILQVTGWHLPVAGLNYWIRGLAIPRIYTQRTNNPDGTPATLQQQGWTIRYLAYSNVAGLMLPARMLLTQHDLSIKLVINAWSKDGG